MSDSDALTVIDYPGQLLDKTTELLAKVGVDLSPGASQAIMLLLCVGVLLAFRKHVWPLRRAAPLWLLGMTVLGLVGVSILATWLLGVVAPLPDHVYGRVLSSDRQEIRVAVVDFRGEPMGTAPVDTDRGDFGIRYVPSFGDRPRALVVKKPGCDDVRHPLARSTVRAGLAVDFDFRCKRN